MNRSRTIDAPSKTAKDGSDTFKKWSFPQPLKKRIIYKNMNSRHFMAYAFLVLEIIVLLAIAWIVFLM